MNWKNHFNCFKNLFIFSYWYFDLDLVQLMMIIIYPISSNLTIFSYIFVLFPCSMLRQNSIVLIALTFFQIVLLIYMMDNVGSCISYIYQSALLITFFLYIRIIHYCNFIYIWYLKRSFFIFLFIKIFFWFVEIFYSYLNYSIEFVVSSKIVHKSFHFF